MKRIEVRPLSYSGRIADTFMHPVMRLAMGLNGTLEESPMRTHRWNNARLTHDDIAQLDLDCMAKVAGDPEARPQTGFWRHFPRFGWQRYAVIEPVNAPARWRVGWHTWEGTGVSRIVLKGSVRLLIGPDTVRFFGLDLSGGQIPVRLAAGGRLGDHTHWNLPLL